MISSRSSGRLVGRIAGTYELAETYHGAAIQTEMEKVTHQVSEIVPEATGLNLLGSPTTVVIGRAEWIQRNVDSFAHLMEPARKKIEERNDRIWLDWSGGCLFCEQADAGLRALPS